MNQLHTLSLIEAANMAGIPEQRIVRMANKGLLPVCFDFCGYVALFQSFTDFDGDVYLSQYPTSDSHPVSGTFRSIRKPALQEDRTFSFRPDAIECVEVFSDSPPDSPPQVPEGQALARVTGPSIPLDRMVRFLNEEPRVDAPRLDDSPVEIKDWRFLQADIDRLRAELQPAPDQVVQPQAAPVDAHDEGAKQADDDAELENLFDPVKASTLEAMFPDDKKWAGYAERACRNGLKEAAKVGRGLFNPYRAAQWWISRQGPVNWKWERCLRVLANNLPARSRDSKHVLNGDFD